MSHNKKINMKMGARADKIIAFNSHRMDSLHMLFILMDVLV